MNAGSALYFRYAQQYGPNQDAYGSPTPGNPNSDEYKNTNMKYCDKPCAGDKSSTCGGSWANQVPHSRMRAS